MYICPYCHTTSEAKIIVDEDKKTQYINDIKEYENSHKLYDQKKEEYKKIIEQHNNIEYEKRHEYEHRSLWNIFKKEPKIDIWELYEDMIYEEREYDKVMYIINTSDAYYKSDRKIREYDKIYKMSSKPNNIYRFIECPNCGKREFF